MKQLYLTLVALGSILIASQGFFTSEVQTFGNVNVLVYADDVFVSMMVYSLSEVPLRHAPR